MTAPQQENGSLLKPMESSGYPAAMVEEAERFIQAALDSLTAHIAILDETGTIIGVNTAWRRFADANRFNDPSYGLGLNYLAVCDASAARNSAEAAAVGSGIRSVMQQPGSEFYLEYPCHSPKEKRWFVVRVTGFEWYGQRRYIVAHQSVSELKRVQVELEESKKRLQAIVDAVVNGIIAFDEHERIVSVNPAAARIFGCEGDSGAEMIGLNIHALIENCTISDFSQQLAEWELVGKRRDGSTFPMYFAVSAVKLSDRRIFTAIIQDITERKRLEAELIEKEKISIALDKEREMREFKSRFMSMMSHELRTPLTSIRLSYDMLANYADQIPEDEKIQYLNNIRVQTEHLTELVRDIMTISRGELQELTFAPELTDLLTYCRDVTEEFQITFHKTHRVTFSSTCRRVDAMIDKKLLRQALTNLLSNSIKYSPEGGEVLFALLCEEQEAVICIVDEGIGIPESDIATLFEPFQRASNVGGLPGTGLGLTIVKQAVDLHKGRIEVQSTVGVGTTFTIHLPLIYAERQTHIEDDWE